MAAKIPARPGALDGDDDDNRRVIHVSGSETDARQPVDLTAEQVRQGHTGDHLRYILIASLALVLVILFGAAMMYAG